MENRLAKLGTAALSAILCLSGLQPAKAQDVGVVKITGPASSCSALSATSHVMIKVVNFGSASIDSVPVSYKINSQGETVTDTIFGVIAPSDTLSFTFGQTVDFSPAGADSILAYTSLANDHNITNDSTRMVVYSMGMPTASFTALNTCVYDSARFVDSSLANGAPITSYDWNFGDSTVSALAMPGHLFAHAGTYKVMLTVATANGCTDTMSRMVTIFARPVASFTSSGSCVGSPVTFANHSTIGSGTLTYLWNFGDRKSISTDSTPVHTYSAGGSYPVTLTVTSSNGCMDSVKETVNIAELPIAFFRTTQTCAGTNTIFENQSSTGNGSIVSYTWDFGDGATSTDSSPSHVYVSAGKYNPVLTVTTNLGCTNSFKDSLTEYAIPVAGFTASNSCQGQAITFANNSTGTGLSYIYLFGDSTLSTDSMPVHTFKTSGKYRVMLVVNNAGGCKDTISDSVTIYPAPVATFSVDNICMGDSARFTNTSSISNDSALTYTWDFGDSAISTLKNPVHKYARAGSFTVSLIVSSGRGCSATMQKAIVVGSVPDASFTVKQISSLTESFMPTDTTGGDMYAWNFGDSATATVMNPTHSYAAQGIYSVRLQVSTGTGCTANTTQQVNVTTSGIATASGINPSLQAYPNPFTGTAHIVYNLDRAALVTLTVYNELGVAVTTLADDQQVPGTYQFDFNTAKDAAPGMYFIRLTVNGSPSTIKLMENR